jgi:Lsr2 protein
MTRIPRVGPVDPAMVVGGVARVEHVDEKTGRPAAVEPVSDPEPQEPLEGDGGPENPVPAATVDDQGPTNAQVRAWARANHHEVPAHGPVSKAVREAYASAHTQE